MCVCPFARARLLGSGPDLAPFLVSLVSPPVAVARYLRAAYGAQGVHITYIGACPGAEDPSIDERLTPGGFIADLAEYATNPFVPPSFALWQGPLNLQDGTVLADSGALVDILDVWYLEQLLEGMVGASE